MKSLNRPSTDARAGRPWPVWLPMAALFVVMRIPSLLEPTWYADEGTYADIGRALDHGAVLYRDVWDNKPPGMYWLAAAVIAVSGPAAPAFHAVLAVIVGAGAGAVWKLGRRLGGDAAGTVATVIFIVLMSLPNLDGDLLNAEPVGAVLVLWAMVLVTADHVDRRWSVTAGLLVGAAVLFKPVFIVDAAALVGVYVVRGRVDGRPQQAVVRQCSPMAAGIAMVWVMAGAVVAVRGELGGLLDVLFTQDVDYVQLTNGPGGSVIHGAGLGARVAATALLLVRTGVPLAAGGVVAWRWSWPSPNVAMTPMGRARAGRAMISWWLGCDLAGAMVSARGLTHYAQQAEGVIALAAGLLAVSLWRRGRAARCAAVLVAVATWPVVELVLLAPRAEVAWANHDPFPPLEHHNFRAAQLAGYYTATWRRLTGTDSTAEYEATFPYDAARLHAVVRIFEQHSRPADRVFVWGSVHWAYALADRVPSGQYVSLNDAYYVDPNSQARLTAEIIRRPPAVMIVDSPLPSDVTTILKQQHYRYVPALAAGGDVWIEPGSR